MSRSVPIGFRLTASAASALEPLCLSATDSYGLVAKRVLHFVLEDLAAYAAFQNWQRDKPQSYKLIGPRSRDFADVEFKKTLARLEAIDAKLSEFDPSNSRALGPLHDLSHRANPDDGLAILTATMRRVHLCMELINANLAVELQRHPAERSKALYAAARETYDKFHRDISVSIADRKKRAVQKP